MRYDKRIYFVKEGQPIRLPNGNWVTEEEERLEVWANVSDVSNQRMTLVYGGFKQGALTIRIQGSYDGVFDHIEMDNKKYRVDNHRRFRRDTAYEVSGMP